MSSPEISLSRAIFPVFVLVTDWFDDVFAPAATEPYEIEDVTSIDASVFTSIVSVVFVALPVSVPSVEVAETLHIDVAHTGALESVASAVYHI
jgi:hypothetical protein